MIIPIPRETLLPALGLSVAAPELALVEAPLVLLPVALPLALPLDWLGIPEVMMLAVEVDSAAETVAGSIEVVAGILIHQHWFNEDNVT